MFLSSYFAGGDVGAGGRVQEMREGGGKKGGVGPFILGCQLLDPSPVPTQR